MYYGNENASDASDVNATFIRVIDGVVGVWHFDEGEGNIAHDTSSEGNDGTLYDGNTTNDDGNTPPQWADGKFGKALRFDGVDDYVEVPDSESLDITDAITIEAWTKTNTSGVVQVVLNKNYAYQLRVSNDLQVVGYIYTGSWHYINSYSLIEPNVWYHIVFTYDKSLTSGNLKLYINGEEAANPVDETGTISSNAYNLLIGARLATPVDLFSGTIDEVHIYNRALSEEEISDLYNNYGYTTPNYPSKVLVRKYTEPEPVAIVGEEVGGIFTTIANFLTIEREIGANYILWKWSCTNPDALVDVFVDGVEVLSAASAVSGEYLLTDVNENELHIIKIANSFNASDYVRDEARTLPPFSFFLALLLTTFVLLVITFATTSTTRVIASIFSLLFTAFTYKYSIYYASPLSYLLLFAFFFTFALMLVEVLRMLTSTIRKKPKWEEDFWSEWGEGGGGV